MTVQKIFIDRNLSYEYQIIDLTQAINIGNQVEIVTAGHKSSHYKG